MFSRINVTNIILQLKNVHYLKCFLTYYVDKKLI